jgi:tripartite-type tricarboxylate transporter receptor subunit TctC
MHEHYRVSVAIRRTHTQNFTPPVRIINCARACFPRVLAHLCMVGALILSGAANASGYPDHPVRLIVGNPPGGPTDAIARALAQRLSLAWKQQVIVDNRPGASEVIAAQATIAARNDGYTLLFCTETPLSLNPFTFARLSYDPEKDFAPVSVIVTAPLVLVVPQSSPAESVEDFVRIARGKASSKPMTYGSAGAGGVLQLPMVMLSRNHQLDLVHVPYKGAAPLLQDLIGGQIDAAWVGVSGAVPFVKDGRLKALVVGGDKRLSALPETPVFSETKVPAERADFMFAIVAPAGTPEDVQNKISASINAIVHDPAFVESQLDPFGYVPIGSTPAAFRSFLVKDRPVQEQRVKLSGVRLD